MKLLRNRKTGATFPYNKGLLRNKDMEPYEGEIEITEINPASQDTGATSDNGIIISRATKAELIKFAFENYGITIEDSLTVPEIREQIKRLQEEE
jgi:hypothetical protein